MASLPNLPVELLFLTYSFLTHKHDLLALSLVSRKLRPSAQKELHRTITLKQSNWAYGVQDLESSKIGYVLRTLIERPDLAKSVRKLNVVVVKHCLENRYQITSSDTCYSPWNISIRRMCQDYLKRQEYCNETWMTHIEANYEPALTGLIIALVPSLESLRMRIYTNQEYASAYCKISGFQDLDFFSARASHFSTRAFFGTEPKNFDISHIPGLASLKCIYFHSELPGQIVNSSNLRTAEFRLQRLPRCIAPTLSHTSKSSNITTLIIHFDVAVLEDQFDLVDAKYEYLKRMITSLKTLTYLSIQLYMPPWSNNTRIEPWGGYDKVLALVENSTLKSLVIDEANIDWSRRRWNDLRRGTTNYDIPCAAALLHLPNLQRIVAPQAFFFNAFKEDPTILCRRCEIPASVTSVEIIDPTSVAGVFAKHLLDCAGSYDGLRKIGLWYDVQKIHLVANHGLDKILISQPDLPSEEAEALQTAMKETSVWGRLKNAGIDVVEEWETKRGWRIVCD
ncbi:hypothetical protein K505DRAFT_419623 [Melanomma pulvis-pyrius CBS 109.77]|uniref:F-box domain-containing protein n=1 Tax=Melanomma pulvis-pyrius CBS 109.77 TaxID=1314802 RepID=A0A6A6X3D8_9PLEO|nr:hypothetical protein K505DRAFT_419623 [Melanomma pulvis-pyrius CBS 109.77]